MVIPPQIENYKLSIVSVSLTNEVQAKSGFVLINAFGIWYPIGRLIK
jgi:hypothetical protein